MSIGQLDLVKNGVIVLQVCASSNGLIVNSIHILRNENIPFNVNLKLSSVLALSFLQKSYCTNYSNLVKVFECTYTQLCS